MNGNDLAKLISEEEGLLQETSIAQIKEILKILSKMCHNNSEVIELMIRMGKKHNKCN